MGCTSPPYSSKRKEDSRHRVLHHLGCMQLPAFGRKVSGDDACLDTALTSEGGVSVSQDMPTSATYT